MHRISIVENNSNNTTMVANTFIDNYMASTNGEFVKVYLYLLRHISGRGEELTIANIADGLNLTERDVLRAMKYWESQDLLKLEYTQGGELSGLCLLECDEISTKETAPLRQKAALSSLPARNRGASVSHIYSREEVSAFKQNEEIKELLYIAEMYLRRTLSPADCQTIFALYDDIGFPADLIEYLIEYCVSRDKTSIRYIEKTGLAWHDAGIRTLDDAKREMAVSCSAKKAVSKEFGLTQRALAGSELEYISKWSRSWGFSDDLISLACRRTIEATHSPSFKYADKILETWKDGGVSDMADIDRLDSEHRSQTAVREKLSKAASKSTSGFNNFTGRDYDYSELSRKLVESTTAK